MAVWCYGSINADLIYSVPHLVAPGETLAAHSVTRMLGGKGANQSVAAHRAGAEVHHIGAVGEDGAWLRDALAGFGLSTEGIISVREPSGHAIIQVDTKGENAILLYPGANRVLPAFDHGAPGDWLMLQNETNGVLEAAKEARRRGMKVTYSAAPFDVDAVAEIMPFVDLLLVNEGENAALEAHFDQISAERVITRGARGAEWLGVAQVSAFDGGEVVDTTGAGDCFAGYLVAGLASHLSRREALERAVIAAGLQVTRKGTAEAMPLGDEVDRYFL